MEGVEAGGAGREMGGGGGGGADNSRRLVALTRVWCTD